MTGLTYKDAGVNIDAGNQLVENIKPYVKETTRPEVLGGLGGFAACVELPTNYKKPVLVSGTDGVGTKLKLAIDWQDASGLGIDLVAMCVNDLLVAGAEPLFFLDYYATGALNVDMATNVIKSIAEGCKQANCALVGGETAEMPGLYAKGDYDLAGFCVGVVEKDKIQTQERVREGDLIIGLKSSGPHSNGYSLIRRIIKDNNIKPNDELEAGLSFRQALLAPTKIYVKALLNIIQQDLINALCHITGGGFYENLPRVLPEGLSAELDFSEFELPNIFKFLQKTGGVSMPEMLRTFNCGIGMVLVVAPNNIDKVKKQLKLANEEVVSLGKIVNSNSAKVDIKVMPKL